MKVVLLLLLVSIATSAVYHKLTSLDPFSIVSGDYITSTLGRFRLTLKAPTCQLQIEAFTTPSY